MATAASVIDFAGNDVQKGDTVITIQGQTSGTVSGVTEEEDGTGFICVRPVHQAYGKGVWYAADQVFRVSRPGSASKPGEPGAPGEPVKRGSLWTSPPKLARPVSAPPKAEASARRAAPKPRTRPARKK